MVDERVAHLLSGMVGQLVRLCWALCGEDFPWTHYRTGCSLLHDCPHLLLHRVVFRLWYVLDSQYFLLACGLFATVQQNSAFSLNYTFHPSPTNHLLIPGGAGLRQSRQADELKVLGETYFNDTDYYLHPGSTVCYDVPQGDETFNGTVIFSNKLLGVTPVCNFDTSNADFAALNVLNSFSFPDSFGNGGYGEFLNVVFIIALAIYFATSSDSGSLVVDHLSANGRLHHHWLQRAFWAITEGAVATAILSAGGSSGLQAVQAASIVFGLPFVFLLIFLVPAISSFCAQAAKDPNAMEYDTSSTQKSFSVPLYGGMFNIFELICSLGDVHPDRIALGMDKPTSFHMTEFVMGVLVPFVPLHQVLSAAYPRNPKSNAFTSLCYGIFYYGWIAIFAAMSSYPGLKVMGWIVFFTAACILSSARMGFRERYNIRSHVAGDFLGSAFFWPQVLTQMRQHCVELGLPNDKSDEDLDRLNKKEQEDYKAAVEPEEEMEA